MPKENILPFAKYDAKFDGSDIPAPIIYIDQRRIGNTTRLVDYYIQVLFTKGTVKIEDHVEVPNHGGLPYIVQIVIKRLQSEHRLDNRNFTVDNKGTITLKDFKG